MIYRSSNPNLSLDTEISVDISVANTRSNQQNIIGDNLTLNSLTEKAGVYLHKLTLDISNRRVGSRGNRLATDYFSEVLLSFNYDIECNDFECIDWSHGGVSLSVGGMDFNAYVSPYTLGCQVNASLVVASTVEELQAIDATSKVILLRGDITKEQLMPKNFTFYNPDQHKYIYKLLETKMPAAIISATSRNPELAGGIYPFPLIEDGDFDIPSVYMTEEEGQRLANYAGSNLALEFDAQRIPSTGCNVIARKGTEASRKIVIWAHIDCKDNTPGALDNGSGVVVLMLLAELLQDYAGNLGLEIVALNGEDYYSAAGEVDYINRYGDKFPDIDLGINLDGAGYRDGNTAYSLYDPPEIMASTIPKIFSSYEGIIEGEQWYQSDHSIFVMNQRPALAITSDRFSELSTYITHTPKDHPNLVDVSKLANIALALRDLILELGNSN
jgi:aminopeptidase YwaD